MSLHSPSHLYRRSYRFCVCVYYELKIKKKLNWDKNWNYRSSQTAAPQYRRSSGISPSSVHRPVTFSKDIIYSDLAYRTGYHTRARRLGQVRPASRSKIYIYMYMWIHTLTHTHTHTHTYVHINYKNISYHGPDVWKQSVDQSQDQREHILVSTQSSPSTRVKIQTLKRWP